MVQSSLDLFPFDDFVPFDPKWTGDLYIKDVVLVKGVTDQNADRGDFRLPFDKRQNRNYGKSSLA